MTAVTFAPAVRPAAAVRLPVPHGPGPIRRMVARLRHRAELRRLLATGDHLLADIGLTADEAAHEAAKPFWRA